MGANNYEVSGNLTRDPQFFGAQEGGQPRVLFRIGHSDRVRDGQGGWQDGPSMFLDVVAFGPLAEHAAQSLHKGDPVTVKGRLQMRERTIAQGERQGQTELVPGVVANDISVSLTLDAVQFARQHQFRRDVE